jgi:hypothetical protein
MQRDLKEAQAVREEKGPQVGDRRARSQRKGSSRNQRKPTSSKKGFKKRGFKN